MWGRNLGSIFDERAELAPATIIHNEYSAVPMNNFGDYMLVRRVSGKAKCELPKREPVVVVNKTFKDRVENTIWIKHHVYSTLLLGDSCRNSDARVGSKCPPADFSQQSIVVAVQTVVTSIVVTVPLAFKLCTETW
jgi:hypothetical protein